MPKKVLIIMTDGVEDIEAVTVIDVLTRAGIEVTVAGLKEGPVRAAYGTTIIPNTTLDNIRGDFDGLVLPGGLKNAQSLAADPKVIELTRKYNSDGRLVGAICAAPSHVLSEAAGIMQGRISSGDPAFNKKLASGGAVVTHQAVAVDGNVITGMGPGAALRFALMLVEHLVGKDIADGLAEKWRISR